MNAKSETTLTAPAFVNIDNREEFHAIALGVIEGAGETGGALVIDMTETEYVDTAGLGVMAMIHRKATDAGLEVRLLNPNVEVRASLALARLDALLNLSEPDA